MEYEISIYYEVKGDTWDHLTTLRRLSLQTAMKDGQTLMRKVRRDNDCRITKFHVDEVETR